MSKVIIRGIRSSRIVVQRQEKPYWEEKGWTKNNGDYWGYYKTKYGSWRGRIKELFLGSYEFIIFEPPDYIKNFSHSSCFRFIGENTVSVHFSRKPKDISAGIIEIERMIGEAYRSNYGQEIKIRF